jgi:hypothetical protein
LKDKKLVSIQVLEQRPRAKVFQRLLISRIPRSPNTRESLTELEGKGIVGITIAYLNLLNRLLPVRPRQISYEPAAQSKIANSPLRQAVEILVQKVRNGDDLAPHLSLRTRSKGFTSRNKDDRDMVLNNLYLHHFHIGTTTKDFRSNELVFAHVTDDNFHIIALIDNHEAFKMGTPERRDLFAAHDKWVSRGLPVGTAYLTGNVTTDGHSIDVVMYALKCCKYMTDFDPRLDDPSYIKELFEKLQIPRPNKFKTAWIFHGRMFGIYERVSNSFIKFLG